MSAEERKQAGWVGAPCDGGDGYASCYFAGGSCVQCGRLAGPADGVSDGPIAAKTAFAPAHGWPSLRWSAQEPKRPGWWWFRASPKCKAFIVEVRAGEAGLFNAFMPWGRTYLYRTTSSEGEWSGPLPEPESASDAHTTANDKLTDPNERR